MKIVRWDNPTIPVVVEWVNMTGKTLKLELYEKWNPVSHDESDANLVLTGINGVWVWEVAFSLTQAQTTSLKEWDYTWVYRLYDSTGRDTQWSEIISVSNK